MDRTAERKQDQDAYRKAEDSFTYSRPLTTNHAHRITLLALASIFGGMMRPICLAGFKLITSSNFVGCSTGRSAGFAPFKILSTRTATRRCLSAASNPYDMSPPASTSIRLL